MKHDAQSFVGAQPYAPSRVEVEDRVRRFLAAGSPRGRGISTAVVGTGLEIEDLDPVPGSWR